MQPSGVCGIFCSYDLEYDEDKEATRQCDQIFAIAGRRDDFKLSHPECADYLSRSSDLEYLLYNRDEERSVQFDQFSCKQTFASPSLVWDPNGSA